MPQNINTPPDDLYSDSAAAAPAEQAPEPQEQEPETEEDTGGSTALLPTSFFEGDVQPGDTCTVTVVRVHDNQVEVKYDKSAESEDYGSEGEEAAPAPQGEMASMME